jgi:adenylate kinase family enzyme
MSKNTLIVNCFGGPGTGKSTTAAGIFHMLKSNDIDSELISEFAKDKTWEKNHVALSNQFYVSANQHHKQHVLTGQVDVIITDSPLIIGLFYYKEPNPRIKKPFIDFILESFNSQNNLNIFLRRKKKFNPNGRNQNEAECKNIDIEIKKFLDTRHIPYSELDADSSCVSVIYDMIVPHLGLRNEIK